MNENVDSDGVDNLLLDSFDIQQGTLRGIIYFVHTD